MRLQTRQQDGQQAQSIALTRKQSTAQVHAGDTTLRRFLHGRFYTTDIRKMRPEPGLHGWRERITHGAGSGSAGGTDEQETPDAPHHARLQQIKTGDEKALP